MKSHRLAGLLLLGGVSICLAAQPGYSRDGSQAEVVRGTLMERSIDDSNWTVVPSGQISQSRWLHTGKAGEATIAFANRSHLRMAEDTTVHITVSDAGTLKLDVIAGRVLTQMPQDGKSTLALRTPKGVIHSTGGEMIVDVDQQKTQVSALSGQPSVEADQLTYKQFGVVEGIHSGLVVPGIDVRLSGSPKVAYIDSEDLIAVDGPDVRARKKRPTYVRGEETGPKRIGEDETPSPSPSPSYTPPPQTSVQPSPTPPPSNPPSPKITDGGGGEVWPYLLGAAALGTGAYFLFRDDSNDNFINNGPFFNNIPASP